MKYARKCDVTNEGMNEGWCWGDGIFYTKYEDDTIKELRSYFESSIGVQTDDELLEWAVGEDILYWTEWEEPKFTARINYDASSESAEGFNFMVEINNEDYEAVSYISVIDDSEETVRKILEEYNTQIS